MGQVLPNNINSGISYFA